jgi:hypothetical protein
MEQFGQNHLTLYGKTTTTPLSEKYLSKAGQLLLNLAATFQRDLSVPVQLIYLEQLRDLPLEKIRRACYSAAKKLKKMPYPSELVDLANERSTEAVMLNCAARYGAQPSRAEREAAAAEFSPSIRQLLGLAAGNYVGLDSTRAG